MDHPVTEVVRAYRYQQFGQFYVYLDLQHVCSHMIELLPLLHKDYILAVVTRAVLSLVMLGASQFFREIKRIKRSLLAAMPPPI